MLPKGILKAFIILGKAPISSEKITECYPFSARQLSNPHDKSLVQIRPETLLFFLTLSGHIIDKAGTFQGLYTTTFRYDPFQIWES